MDNISPDVVDHEERVRVPGHSPAVEGQQVKPDSEVDDGNIVLHLSVKCNHSDVLRLVLDSTGDDGEADVRKMINSLIGKTILHLAVVLQRAEVGGAGANNNVRPRNNWCKRVWLLVKSLMDYKGNWMEETRGALMTVSSIIATVTFAAAVSPPGGVWQVDTTDSAMTYRCDSYIEHCPVCSYDAVCYAGSAVLAYYYPDLFIKFMSCNTVSFISSLVVLFLLISGFPFHNKFCMWLLSLAMCVTISFLCVTFFQAGMLVLPESKLLAQYYYFGNVTTVVWIVLICVAGLCLLIRLSSWLARFKSAWPRLLGFFTSLSKLLPENLYSCWQTRRRPT